MHGMQQRQPGMPTELELNFVSQHTINYVGNAIFANPAIPAVNRLYMILNTHHQQSVYVGTALNVADRFTPRFNACREMGFAPAEVTHIRVYTIEVRTNGVLTPPGDSGRTEGQERVDVEHLLIRTCMHPNMLNWPVRNIAKTEQFHNFRAWRSTLWWRLNDLAGIGHIIGAFPFHHLIAKLEDGERL